MTFVVKRLAPAEEDALEAALWYDKREPGLGEEFLVEVDRAAEKLTSNALLNRVRFGDVRRASLGRFKIYGIYYYIQDRDVVVIAIQRGRKPQRTLVRRRGVA